MTQQEFFNRYTYSVKSDRIGGGGFGTVYRATDTLLHRKVAIKVSEVKFFGDKEFSLKAEFDAVGKLPPHPNIAHYEELYSFESPQGVFDYAIMQYYEDGNLKNLLGQGGLTLAQKEQIARGILDGIAFLHRNKVVHRDLKPANILICREGDGYIPLITDFGLSKGVDEMSKSGFTNSIAGAGSLGYMSPEQFKNSRIQLNTDLWSYGVIVYELFSGRRLFQSALQTGASAEVQDMILHKDISREIASLPGRWSKVAGRCLVRDNKLRAKSADELYDVLGGSAMHETHDSDETVTTDETEVIIVEETIVYDNGWTQSAEEGTVADNRVHVEPKHYSIVAKDKDDLQRIIKERMEKFGPNCDLNDIDVSNVKDMSYMFYDSPFNGNISKWDVSKVTNMSDMFRSSPFNGDISKWNVSKVTDMSYMFYESEFNGDISKWDVSKVTDMSFMFSHSQFNGGISKWNVSNVTYMISMFSHSQFKGDISKWDVRNVKDMRWMFQHSQFNGDISKWNVSKVTDMSEIFSESEFNGDISEWDVSNVTNMWGMFSKSKFNGDISKWDVSKVTDMSSMFAESKFNGDISKWNVSKVKDMSGMFRNSPLEKNKPMWFKWYKRGLF